jgi:hypothetical protein
MEGASHLLPERFGIAAQVEIVGSDRDLQLRGRERLPSPIHVLIGDAPKQRSIDLVGREAGGGVFGVL